MSRLSAKARAQLSNSAFAYVNSKGQRRLPIHDEAHVRNALARFNQIRFEDDAARERARKRLLNAAKKYGIVPIGFITGQLATERLESESKGRDAVSRNLPTGQVTFLLTDIEDSTGLVRRVGDGYASLLGDVRRLLRHAVQRSDGREVDARADELFAAFKRPAGALEAAIAIQRSLRSRAWPDGASVRVRIGLHTGRPTLTDSGYVGLAVHTAARICAVGHGGQIVLSSATARAVEASLPVGVRLRQLGTHHLQGLRDPETLFQLEADGLPVSFPPPRTAVESADRQREPHGSRIGGVAAAADGRLPSDIVFAGSQEESQVGVGDKLRKVGNYVRKRWRSTGADSYDHYKRAREREHKQAEQRRERDERHGEQEREEAERGLEYEERYRAERAAAEPRTEAPRSDPSQPE